MTAACYVYYARICRVGLRETIKSVNWFDSHTEYKKKSNYTKNIWSKFVGTIYCT